MTKIDKKIFSLQAKSEVISEVISEIGKSEMPVKEILFEKFFDLQDELCCLKAEKEKAKEGLQKND